MIPTAFAPLVTHLWQSTVFAAVAGLLTLALRRNQARVRYWLWLAASYKFLIPFSWLVSLGALFEWRTAPAIVPSPVFSVMTDAIGGPVFLTPLPTAKPTPDHFLTLLFVIWAVWACGFVVVAAGWVREWLRIRAMVRAASPLHLSMPTTQRLGCHSEEQGDEESLFLSSPTCGEILRPVKGNGTQTARCAQNDSKKQKALRVVSTKARLEPGVFGIFRPVLLLPEGIADRLTRDQLQAILAHELCHVRRRDNLTAAVHMLVEALFWFYPLVWWMGARLIDEREAACDEEVLQAGGQAEVYAESILKVCEFYLESPLTCMSGVTGSDLKKRIQQIMKEHFGAALSAQKKLLLVTAAVAALAVPLAVGVLRLQAQSPAVPEWQTAAGGKMAFDVASIKENVSVAPAHTNIGLSNLDEPGSPGGYLSAVAMPLNVYIMFAYKLSASQVRLLTPQLPNWAATKRFDIEARAVGNPTRDQLRLMMQAVLADRFKMMVHFETRQVPVFVLVLAKPGRTGPQLIPHSDDPPCAAPPKPGSAPPPPTNPDDRWFTPCGGIGALFASGHIRVGSRNLTMKQIAEDMSPISGGSLDRPVLDQTGLSGNYDLKIEYTPTLQGPPPPNFQPDPTGPTFLEALQEQLGLKLTPTIGPVDVLVIDHVEEPTPN